MVEENGGISAQDQFIPVNEAILDELNALLDDKDTFLVKLPHKFKDHLGDPTNLLAPSSKNSRVEPKR